MSFATDVLNTADAGSQGITHFKNDPMPSKTGNLQSRAVAVRCGHDSCKKKLGLVEQTIKCACEKVFCDKHRLMLNHDCSKLQDRIAQQKKELEERLLSVKVDNRNYCDISSSHHYGDHAF